MDAERLKERLVGQSPQQAHIVLRFAAVKLRHIDDAAVHQAGYGFRLFVNKHADGGNAGASRLFSAAACSGVT